MMILIISMLLFQLNCRCNRINSKKFNILNNFQYFINKKGLYSIEWNYEEYGPDEWPIMFKTCGGKKQSPINIIRNKTIYDINLKKINFYNYAYPYNWYVLFNNHTGRNFIDEDLC